MSTPHASLDSNLMATMTPEEREAINGADPDEIASLAAVGAEKDPVHAAPAGAAEPEPEEDDGDDSDDGDAEPEAEAAAPVETAAPAETQAEAAPAPVAALPEPVAYQYQLPSDFEDRRAAVRTANAEALDRFEAGDLTKEELLSEQERIANERRELDAMQTRAEIAVDMQRQVAEATRMAAVNRLFEDAAKPEAGGIDYRKDAAKMRDLDVFVKVLAADEANADKPLAWFLDEAHRRVKVLHGAADTPAPAPAAKPKTAAETKAAAAAARKPDLAGSTPDLSQVPGGSDASDVGGEFEDVMSLEGVAFEQAIQRMAKTQPERFARFQSAQQ